MKSIPVSSIYQLVCLMENTHGNHPAMRYYDDSIQGVREISYLQYAADIRRVAAELKSLVPDLAGQRVCILAGNSYHFAVSIFGVLLSGAVVVPLNLQKNWDEIQYELDLVEPAYILHDGEFAAREPALAAAYGGRLLPVDGYKTSAWSDGCAECADRDALSVILFTSGTTGRSKGVMISQRNLFAPMRLFTEPFEAVRRQWGLDADYQFSAFSVLPLYHIAALSSLISWSISGNAVNFCTDLRRFYRDLAAMPSDVMAVVPTLLKSIHHDVVKGKAACKQALQQAVGLQENPDVPIIACVSRLVGHKGFSLVSDALHDIMGMNVQMVVLGTGDWQYEETFRHAQSQYPGRFAAQLTYSAPLSNMIYAGADLFLMPSISEPCGLSQMIAMRFGTIPVVRETGGLKDTVTPYNKFEGTGRGFTFSNISAGDMTWVLREAVDLYYNNKKAWRGLQKESMTADFSWDNSAKQYLDIYQRILG